MIRGIRGVGLSGASGVLVRKGAGREVGKDLGNAWAAQSERAPAASTNGKERLSYYRRTFS